MIFPAADFFVRIMRPARPNFLAVHAAGFCCWAQNTKFLVIFAACVFFCASSMNAVEPPNIVYILADDLGYGDLGCYNPKSKIPTPRLNQFASEGMRFTDAHSPSSVCTPTRYALLTGRYAWRTRLQRNVLGPWDKPLIAPDRLTVGKLLQRHGYATACVGKWHLGQTYVTTDGKPAMGGAKNALSNVDFTQAIADGPITRGFDHYFGTIVPNYPPYCFVENDRTVGIPAVLTDGGNFNIPGPMVPGWKLENILPELTRHAVKWIEESAKTKKPFFLYLPLTSPHYPVVPAAEFIGSTKVGAYGDFVHQTDWTIGQVLDALERGGVAENTLVIFTSDNGAEITGEVNPGAYDRVQQFDHRSSGELRGAKRDAWEGGHRVPFIARWPGKVQAGTTSHETICHVDFMATLAAILGRRFLTTQPKTASVFCLCFSANSARRLFAMQRCIIVLKGNLQFVKAIGFSLTHPAAMTTVGGASRSGLRMSVAILRIRTLASYSISAKTPVSASIDMLINQSLFAR